MASIFSGFSYNPPSKPSSQLPPSSANRRTATQRADLDSNEVDHFLNPTKLFKRVEERAWVPTLSRAEKNPNEAKTWVVKRSSDGSITWRRLPIHQACMGNPPPEVVLTLLQCYPNSARKVDSNRRLPLHHACANGASLEVVKHLLMAHPDGVHAEDIWFKSPLQTLLSSSNPEPSIISALKKGSQYYRMKVADARAKMIPIESSMVPAASKSFSSPPSPAASTKQMQSLPNSASMNDRSVIINLEEELGKFSERLAVSVDQENVLKKRIQELEDKNMDLEQVESENLNLQNELNKYRQDLKSHQVLQRELEVKKEHLRRIESGNGDLQRELGAKSESLYRVDSENIELKNALSEAKRELEKINAQSRRVESENDELKQDLHEMQRKLKVKSDNLLTLDSENNDLKDDLNCIDTQNMELKQDIKQYRDDLSTFEEVKRSKEELERQVNDMRQSENLKIKDLQDKLFNATESLREEALNYREYVGKTEQERAILNSDLTNMTKDAEEYRNEIDSYKTEQAKLISDLDTLKTINASLDEASTTVKAGLAEANSENEKLSEKIKKLNKDIEEMEDKIKSTNDKLKKTEEEKAQLEETIKDLKKMKDEIKERDVQIEEKKKTVNEREQEIEDLRRRLYEFEHREGEREMSFDAEYGNLKGQCDDLEEDLRRSEKKLVNAVEDKEEIEKKLKDQRQKNEELETEVDSLKRKEKELTRELDEAKNAADSKVVEYESKLNKEHGDIEVVKNMSKGMEEKNATLQHQLAEVTQAKDELQNKLYELHREIDNNEGEGRSLRVETLTTKAENEHIIMENQQLHATIESLMSQLNDKDKQGRKSTEYEIENKMLQEKILTLMNKVSELSSIKTDLNGQVQELHREMSEEESNIRAIHDEAVVLQKEKEELEAENKKLQETVSSLLTKLGDSRMLRCETVSLMTEKDGLDIENRQLQETIMSLQSRISDLSSRKTDLHKKFEQRREIGSTDCKYTLLSYGNISLDHCILSMKICFI
jgi:chromosome segregation ATPase